MKHVRLAVIGVVMGVTSFVSVAHAAAPLALIKQLFANICLASLPDHKGLIGALKENGFEVGSNGTYHEFSHPDAQNIWGAVEIDGANSSCSILHEGLSEVDAQQIGLQVLNAFSSDEPMMWTYEGVPSGWIVPFKGRMLYVIYHQGGLSADIRDK